MGNIFNMDNKFFTVMTKVADLLLLNIVTIICCIPIVTAGPAITALYYVTLKMARNEETYVIRSYFHSFRENLKQGIAIGVIMELLGVLLLFDLLFIRNVQAYNSSTAATVATVMFTAFLIVYVFVFFYVFPILARFYNTVRNTFRNALLMLVRHFPYTLAMTAITVVPLVIMFGISTRVLSYMILYYILLGFAVDAFLKSLLFVRIFDNYMPDEETSGDAESGEDEAIDGSVFKNLEVTELPEEDESEDGSADGSEDSSVETAIDNTMVDDTVSGDTAVEETVLDETASADTAVE